MYPAPSDDSTKLYTDRPAGVAEGINHYDLPGEDDDDGLDDNNDPDDMVPGPVLHSGGVHYEQVDPHEEDQVPPSQVLQALEQQVLHLQGTSHWDNLWVSRGGSMVNGAPREFPESTQCTP